MGLLVDVVVADPSDALEVCEDINSTDFIWGEMPGLSVQMLVALLAVLSNRRMSKALQKDFPLIYGDECGDGPWAFHISDDLIRQLFKVKNSELSELATRWLKMDDEVKLLGLSVNGHLSGVKKDSKQSLASLYLLKDSKGKPLSNEEIQRRYRSVQGLEDYLANLRDLCKKAVQRKTSLLLRVCL